MANAVTLTFAGDTTAAEKSFDRVGGSAERMSSRVGDSAGGFERAGEAADGAEGKAQGFSDTLTGVADIGGGTAEILKGNLFEGFVTVGQGAADLAGGLASFLIPALQKTKIATIAKAAADKVAAGASKVWAAAQWLMNTALLASPITWIIVGIVALIAIIVLIVKKTDWFSKAWRAAWSWITRAAKDTWDYLKKIPGWIGTAFSKIANFILWPYKTAFNGIARAWNATVGRLSWSVPAWVPFIGGNNISVPNLPTFHAGGRVPGVVGRSVMTVLQGGEQVGSVASGVGNGQGQWIRVDLGELGDALLPAISRAVGRTGGRVGALGIRVINGQVRA
jgi:phage-related protein